MEGKRPDPDELLKRLQQDSVQQEKVSKKGRLKIFLGYSAGVGKTYRMLQEAALNKKNGIDVVVGIAETHRRKETDALLSGLEIIARKKIAYGGISLEEMDLDAVLARKPRLAIVDELAHTNAPGSRHAKRYQDVEELISAGIDVFTTLNVQHVESLVDVVHQIAGVTIRETVPDRLLEVADEIELVDLTPEKLLERFQAGKVYVPEKAEQAMRKFFLKGNLLALRELSLHYTARHVEDDVRTYMEKHAIPGPWPVGSRLLVGISSSPTSERLIRFTHRMAAELDAEWYAIYVESYQHVKADENAVEQLNRNIRLAEELGANVVSLNASGIADEITDFARKKNVSLIIVGLSQRSRLQEFFRGSVISELVKKSGPMNVLIVGEGGKKTVARDLQERKTNLRPYLASLATIVFTAGAGWFFLRPWIEPVNVGLLLLLPAIASGILWGNRVGIFAALLSVAAFDFFFIPPYLSFRISDLRYFPSFVVFIVVCLAMSFMARLVRWQVESSRQREHFISALYSFSRSIMAAENVDEAVQRAVQNISEAFGYDVALLLPDESGKLRRLIRNKEGIALSDSEKAVAEWVHQNGKPAGWNTRTLYSIQWYFLPLQVKDRSVGVIGLKSTEAGKFLSPGQDRLFESFAGVIALALSKPYEKHRQ
jgi:two-component system sensor histidine kinase KdpD